MRFDTTLTFGKNPTDTAAYLQWTPGAVGPNGLDLVFNSGVTAASTPAAVAIGGSASSPGYLFLSQNASAFRTVAAAMQITYPGSELTRAGRIHYGQATGGLVDVGDTPVIDGVLASLNNWERTPGETIQINLRPGSAETIFQDAAATTLASTKDRCASLVVGFADLPVNTGMYIHLTLVVEWKPTVSKGMASTASTRAMSRSTMDDVFNYLERAGYEFMGRAGHAIGTGAIAAVTAALGYQNHRAITGRQGFAM